MSGADPVTRGELNIRSKSTRTDAVSDMDLRSERLISAVLLDGHPHDAVVAEEGTEGTRPASEPVDTDVTRWVVDPLDGTVNYLYGLPHWAVSIAAQRSGITLVGVVAVPALGEEFWAVRGHGAWLGKGAKEPVRLGPMREVPLAECLVATGFGYAAERRQQQAQVLAQLAGKVRDVRRLGAAAVDLAHTAAGRVDAYFESGLHPWDHTAGELIVREAGGVVTGLGSDEAGPGMVVAGPRRTHADLRAALRHAAAEGLVPEQPTVP